jgi:phage terminase large subunit-like protein
MNIERFDLLHLFDVLDTKLGVRSGYKLNRFFHECLPGCNADSPHPKDHVPLPGNDAPTCRRLYDKALRYMKAGATFPERLFLAANRIGKSETAGYEVTAHLTGRYPRWWEGRKFEGPTDWRAAGDTMLTTRDIQQTILLGPHEGVPESKWLGMIPAHLIADVTRKSGGVSNCVDTIFVQHAEKVHGAPALSRLSFLSYDMGRRVFQGFQCHGMWLDEEPPEPQEKAETQAQGSSDIYTECLLRLMTLDGILLATFTPLRGMTPFLVHYFSTAMMPGTEEDEGQDVPAKRHYLRAGMTEEELAALDPQGVKLPESTTIEVNPYGQVTPRYVVGATWDDAPHLTDAAKAKQWASIMPYQRAARAKGLPQLGAGAIYPISDDDLRVKDFPIPEHWKRGYGMDCGGGAKPTAAAFGALDPDADILYVTSVYKSGVGQTEPALHASSIKSRMGGWNWPGVGDAAALLMTEHDAEQLVMLYRRLGLDLNLPDKSVETGIKEVWDRMTTGRLKVFASCVAWFQEFAMYRRDKHGRIVKSNDHVMDGTRYLVRSGVARMKTKPVEIIKPAMIHLDEANVGLGWMG